MPAKKFTLFVSLLIGAAFLLLFFALAVPGGWWTLPSVAVMNLLLLKVSGGALLEKTIAERRPGYREYVESTPAFLPRPPKGRR